MKRNGISHREAVVPFNQSKSEKELIKEKQRKILNSYYSTIYELLDRESFIASCCSCLEREI